jgi:hypothetical protein
VAVQIYLNNLPKVLLSKAKVGVFALRSRVGFFGHNAPKWGSLPRTDTTRRDAYPEDWDDLDANPPAHGGHTVRPTTIWQDSQGNDLVTQTGFDVLLERPVPEVIKDGWMVLETAGQEMLSLRVGRAAEVSRADYALSAKCTGLQLQNVDGSSITNKNEAFKNRTTTAYVQSEPLTVIGAPIETKLAQGDAELALDRVDKDLVVGQAVALKGDNSPFNRHAQRQCRPRQPRRDDRGSARQRRRGIVVPTVHAQAKAADVRLSARRSEVGIVLGSSRGRREVA